MPRKVSLIRETFPVGPLGCNCSILGDAETREGVVVDPGDDAEHILKRVEELGLTIGAIVHTHAHMDHIGATHEVAAALNAPTYLHAEDEFLRQMLPTQAALIGLPPPPSPKIDAALSEGWSHRFGAYEIGTMHTPGHTPGSCCFHVPGADLCFSGDTLFQGSIGRTDLWGGDSELITRSIRDRLYSLQGDVEVVTGHGPHTWIDRERRTNPFVRAPAP